jgi:hypothetical protein
LGEVQVLLLLVLFNDGPFMGYGGKWDTIPCIVSVGVIQFTQHHNASLIIWNWFECRLVLNAVKKLPKDTIAGFYTLEARNPRTGEKIGLDIGESDGKFKAHHLFGP